MSEGSQLFRLFGNIRPGPLHPNNPADRAEAWYDERTGALRYTHEPAESGGLWAVDAKTGERAFHVGIDNAVTLPNGQQLRDAGAPFPAAKAPGLKLYGKS